MYGFFAKHILGDADAKKYAERSPRIERPPDMLALHHRTLPPGALDYDGLFRRWKAASQRQTATASPGELRQWLTFHALGAEWPGEVISDTRPDSGEIVLSRAGKGDRVPGLWIAGDRRAGGPAAATKLERLRE